MNHRIRLGSLVIVCVAVGWVAGQISTPSVRAQPAGNSSSTANAARFLLHVSSNADGWQAWRIERNSGDTWREVANNKLDKLFPIKERTAVPSSDYDLFMSTYGNTYMVHRLDLKSGRMWRVTDSEWEEVTP